MTGGFERRLHPRRGLRETQSRFAMRIVCPRCAYLIDRQEGRITRIEDLKLYAALGALAVLIVLVMLGILTF